MQMYNDVTTNGTVFGIVILFMYLIFIIVISGIGIYVLILMIKFLKAGTKAFYKYLNEDE